MVDQEALESVLNAKNDLDETGFVRLVEAGWEPEVLDEEELRARNGPELEEALEGCALHDVGWMKVPYADVQVSFVHMDDWYWDSHYSRPAETQKLLWVEPLHEARGGGEVFTFQVLAVISKVIDLLSARRNRAGVDSEQVLWQVKGFPVVDSHDQGIRRKPTERSSKNCERGLEPHELMSPGSSPVIYSQLVADLRSP